MSYFKLSIEGVQIATIKSKGQQNAIDKTVVAAEFLRFFNTCTHFEISDDILPFKDGTRRFIGRATIGGKTETVNGELTPIE